MDPKEVSDMIESAGGKVTSGAILPDGHAFMTASFPLQPDHWLYQTDKDGFTGPPPMPFRMGTKNPRYQEFNEKVRAAAKYAIKASTRNGKDEDFDPDAMVQNMLVGLLGYHSEDGLSQDSWANPDPVPPLYGEEK
jgi:hypothetical protein